MPSQAERRRRTKGKPSIITQARKQKSSRNTWQLFAFGLFVAVASAGYYYLYGARPLNISELQNVEEDPMVGKRDIFNVVDIPGKGKGAIAARDIRQGELLLQERPLFTVPRNVNSSPSQLIAGRLARLDPDEREEFFELSFVNFPEDLKPEEHSDEVALSIFQTNAVSAGEDVGIFTTMARLNHGCSSAFNVVYSWRDEGYLVVYALKDIKKGQELLTTYTNTKKPRDQRRAFLSEQYGFHCTCDVCSLPEDESKASDRRLSKISLLYEQFSTWGKGEIEGDDAIEIIRTIWRLEDEEGYWSERGSLAADAAWIAASHSDATATQVWARKAVEWFTIEIGGDTPQVRKLMTLLDRPESHKAWGTRNTLEVGGPEPANH